MPRLTYKTPDVGYPDSVDVYEYSIRDGPQNERETFEGTVRKLLELFRDGEAVFVHCNAGKSRSPAVSADAIALYEDVSFSVAMETVQKSRDINPHPALLERGEQAVDRLR